MSWRFERTGWVLEAGLREPGKEPQFGSHIAWAHEGRLCMAKLTEGDILAPERDTYLLNTTHLGDCYQVFFLAEHPLPISFLVREGKAILTIDPDWWLPDVGYDRLELAAAALSTVSFQRDSRMLKAEVPAAEIETLPASVVVKCVGEFAACDASAQWVWAGRCDGLAALNPSGLPVAFSDGGSKYRKSQAYLLLDSEPPSGLIIAEKWRFGDRSAGVVSAEGLYPVVDSANKPVTVAEVLDCARQQPIQLTAPLLSVHQSVYSFSIPRCFATIANDNSISAKECGHDVSPWAFGPEDPFYPGEVNTAVSTFWLRRASAVRAENSAFACGALPSDIGKGKSVIFTRNFPGQISGFLNSACEVHDAVWHPSHIVGPGFVCWRGFVDRAKVHRFRLGDSERVALLFESGFLLDSHLWFAAPFAGVAMNCNAEWWSPMEGDPDAKCSAPDQWQVEGEWLNFDIPNGVISSMPGMTGIDSSPYMAFFDGDIGGSSGAILHLQGGKKQPRLAGFFADEAHHVALPQGGRAVLGSEALAIWTLPSGSATEEAGFTPEVCGAFRFAMGDKRHASGRIDDFEWTRFPNRIEVRELPRSIGIYVSELAAPLNAGKK